MGTKLKPAGEPSSAPRLYVQFDADWNTAFIVDGPPLLTQQPATQAPKEGDVWRSACGAERYVRGVEEGYSVTYSRPADGHREWLTVLMRDWLIWAASATRMRKSSSAKDWRYATDG